MVLHRHAHRMAHRHVAPREDVWDSFTRYVGHAFNAEDSDQTTVVKTVYKTSVPDGYTGPLMTVTVGNTDNDQTADANNAQTTTEKAATTSTAQPKTTKQATTPTATTAATTQATTAKAKGALAAQTTSATSTSASETIDVDSSGLPTSIAATTAAATDSVLTLDTTTKAPTTTAAAVTSASASSTATSSSSGTSSAAKAGIAIGVLAGVFIVFIAAFLLFQRHKKQREQKRREDDEKMNGPFSDSAAIGGGNLATAAFYDPHDVRSMAPSTKTSARAPRLSLRPVTQFLPTIIGGAGAGAAAGAAAGAGANRTSYPDRRTSRGAAIALQNTTPTSASRSPGGSPWDRPTTSSSNPFGDDAERPDTAVSELPGSSVGATGSARAPAELATTASAGAAAGLMRKASTRKDGPKALDLTLTPPTIGKALGGVPPSPAGTEFSVSSLSPGQSPGPSASAAAIAAAGGPAVSTVHRVQLDFKPTLEDEMELRAGQLVRLLHEYDDGWALCIRLDRSQQGVVPRTCLSTRPVKPRPAPGGNRRGPPINPNRPMTPQGRPGPGPMGPGRPQSPGGPRMNRPQSPYSGPPGGGRAQSPGPRYQPQGRPQSPSGMSARRMSPPGPSQMNQQMRPGTPSTGPTGPIGRKPVPGQAY